MRRWGARFPQLIPVLKPGMERQFDAQGAGVTGRWSPLTDAYARWKAQHFRASQSWRGQGSLAGGPYALLVAASLPGVLGAGACLWLCRRRVRQLFPVRHAEDGGACAFDFDAKFEADLKAAALDGIRDAIRATRLGDRHRPGRRALMATVEVERFAVTALGVPRALKLPSRVSTVNASRFCGVEDANGRALDHPCRRHVGDGHQNTRWGVDLGSLARHHPSGPGGRGDRGRPPRLLRRWTGRSLGADQSGTRPTTRASVVSLSADSTGANAAFGWDAGGVRRAERPLPRASKGIMDGGHSPRPEHLHAWLLVLLFDDRSSTPRFGTCGKICTGWNSTRSLFHRATPAAPPATASPSMRACARGARMPSPWTLARYAGWSQTTNQNIQKVIGEARISGRTIR